MQIERNIEIQQLTKLIFEIQQQIVAYHFKPVKWKFEFKISQ